MTAAVEAVELRRAVWRQEYGYLSRDRVRTEWLEEEYRRALDEFDALAGGRLTIRVHAPALLREHDEALHLARRVLDEEGILRLALNHLLHARERMARMRELLDAHAALERAAQKVERLREAVRVPRLRALPCVDAPARLLDAARTRLREGAYSRSAYLAGAALRQAAPLQPGDTPDLARAATLETAFREMREVCAETAGLLPDPSTDLGGDGTLDAAAALADEGFLALGERVAEELMALLAPRFRFHRALREGGGGASATLPSLRHRLAEEARDEDPWTAATRLLWQARFDDGLRRIRGGQEALEHAPEDAADEVPGVTSPASASPLDDSSSQHGERS